MITGGTLTKERLSLTTESEYDAKLVKGGLSGRNDSLTITPFGNRINLKIEGSNLSIKKDNGGSFTFEEIHALLKKVHLFGRVPKLVLENLMCDARVLLRSNLTLFFPTETKPVAEISFAYNWASLEVASEQFGKIVADIKQVIKKNKLKSIKVFSDNVDIVTFHNYAMNGIYINRASFEGIAEVLTSCHLLVQAQHLAFAVRSCAFAVKSVSYMEARRLVKSTDDLFDMNVKSQLSPDMGDIEYFLEIMEIFSLLCEDYHFSILSDKQLQLLIKLASNPQLLEEHKLPETICHSIAGFVSDFSADINHAADDKISHAS